MKLFRMISVLLSILCILVLYFEHIFYLGEQIYIKIWKLCFLNIYETLRFMKFEHCFRKFFHWPEHSFFFFFFFTFHYEKNPKIINEWMRMLGERDRGTKEFIKNKERQKEEIQKWWEKREKKEKKIGVACERNVRIRHWTPIHICKQSVLLCIYFFAVSLCFYYQGRERERKQT